MNPLKQTHGKNGNPELPIVQEPFFFEERPGIYVGHGFNSVFQKRPFYTTHCASKTKSGIFSTIAIDQTQKLY
jgi:hypothetical protein